MNASEGAERVALSCLRQALDAYLDSDADARHALSDPGDIVVGIVAAHRAERLL